MTEIFGLLINVSPWIIVPIFVIAWWFVSKAFLLFLKNFVKQWPAKSETKLDDILIEILQRPLVLALFLGGVIVVLKELPTKNMLLGIIEKTVLLILGVLVIYTLIKLLIGMVTEFGKTRETIKSARPILILIIRFTVISVGVLMILDTMGISITPILTTLGIGSLAVALALQDTLSNFFAGIYMSVDQPIRVGDYIRVDSGDEGYVDNIGWRSTRIRSLSNNSIIIPNQRLSQSVITNYFLPEPRMSLLIQIDVSYESDPEKVEHILLETAKRAKDIDGLILDSPYSPIVRFIPGFAESSLQFTLVCQVKQFIDQYPVQHELRKRILKRFQQERISIPFPTRTIYLDNRIKRK